MSYGERLEAVSRSARQLATLERLCRQLGGVESPFDEIARLRADARLRTELAAEPARRGKRAFVRAATAAAVVATAAAVAAAVILVAGPSARSRPGARPDGPLRFEPYVVALVSGGVDADAVVPDALTRPSSRMEVPAGWLVRATVGDATRVTVVGPARVSVQRTADSARIDLQLAQGLLLAELEGGGGRQLRVVSPGAVTTVVGTLFAVEAEGGASRVSVAHGRVRVSAPSLSPLPSRGDRAHEYLREIASGQSWLTTQPDPGALAPSLEEALTDHARIAAPTGTAVPLAVAGAPIAADVWIDDRRVASAPAWMRVDARAMVRLSARGYQDAIWR